jgi:hypothetical protein
LCGNKFTLHHENNIIININSINKLENYKNCIFYSIEHNIYRQIIRNIINQPQLIYKNYCHCTLCFDYFNYPDFDILLILIKDLY